MNHRWSVSIVKIADGLDPATVAADLAEAWKMDRENVDALLAMLPTTVKSFSDREEAIRYRNRLETFGVVGSVDEIDTLAEQSGATVKMTVEETKGNANSANIIILLLLIAGAVVTGGLGLSMLMQRAPDVGEIDLSLPSVSQIVEKGKAHLPTVAPTPPPIADADDIINDIRPDAVDVDPSLPLLTPAIGDLPRPVWWDQFDAPSFDTVDELIAYWRDKERHEKQFAKAAFDLLRRNPDNGHVVMTVANLYPHTDPDYPALESLFRNALENHFDHRLIEYGKPADIVAGVTRKYAELLLKQGRPEEGVRVIDRFLSAREHETNDHLLELMALLKAKALVRSGRKNEAIVTLGAAIEQYNGDWEERLIKAKRKLEK